MKPRYVVIVPPTRDQGSTRFIANATYMETMKQNALWEYNRLRAHDGQAPITRMPKGTRYEKVPNA